MMSRKHYRQVARIVDSALNHDEADPIVTVKIMAAQLADMFAEDNPHFRRQDFFEACGMSAEAARYAYH